MDDTDESRQSVSQYFVRSDKPQPLKTLNYQQSSTPNDFLSVKQNKMSQEADIVKPKQKITLSEYRERAKSKSPPKKEEGQTLEKDGGFCKASEMIGLVNPGIRRDERLMSVEDRPGNGEERLMSTESVADVSIDLANMSIDNNETFLDETTGTFIVGQNNDKADLKSCASKTVERDGNKLKLKKSSEGTSQIQAKALSDTGDVMSLPLSERIRIKSGDSSRNTTVSHISGGRTEVKDKVLTGPPSPDIIDLTSDEESPEPVQKFQTFKQNATAATTSTKTFGGTSAPVASFETLKQKQGLNTGPAPGQSNPAKNWTEVRDNSKIDDIKASNEAMAKEIRLNIGRRNELLTLLQKQKTLVASVKMSSLPDKGEKLRTTIETLTKDIADMDRIIKRQTALLNERIRAHPSSAIGVKPKVQIVHGNGTVTTQQSNPPQVQVVHPNGTVTTQQGLQPIQPKQPQVIKIYPNGQAVPISGVNTTGVNRVPHNPDGMRQTTLLPHVAQIPAHILQQMYAANPQAMQLYGGRMTAARLREVGSVTKEAIEKLHKQLETCPKPDEELEDPKGLLVTLMVHQRQALVWLVWRERQSPSGGILADDMGLGKTLTIISLILKQNELKKFGSEEDKEVWLNRDKQVKKMDQSIVKSSATLIIAPASLIHHWRTEIERRCKPGLLRVCMYHGQNREKNVLKLASYDVVLTTYNIVAKEVEVDDNDKNGERPVKDDGEEDEKEKDGDKAAESEKKTKKLMPNIMRIAWERIVLDEGHNIKNHKSLQSRAVSRLRAGFRWALTGTPIQNDLLDMYSLLRFLRCSPFDEYKVWKRQVDTGSSTGQSRLNVLVKCLLLRRTKSQKGTSGKSLVPLPEKSSKTHELKLSDQERAVYEKIFAQSRSVLKEYLKRHEEKDMLKDGYTPQKSVTNPFQDKTPAKTGTVTPVADYTDGASKSTAAATGQHILVLLLRLRQCCCHLSLMKDAVDDETQQNEGLELTLEEQMMDLMLGDDKDKEPAVKKSSQIFEKEALSSKMKALLDELRVLHCSNKPEDKCKSVIVSQWTKMLDIVAVHLQKMNIKCAVIQGNIPAKKRMESVDQFNNDIDGPQVMLVSLRAGGCGLNLIGGNHLFLLDSHWNPALEDQACDRIYRVGQKKNVFIHRFLCKETVEEKILDLQKRKQSLADSVLTGSATAKTKLSLQDLRMLFGV